MGKSPAIIDADGHIFEDHPGIWKFMPAVFSETSRRTAVFPGLDHLHTPVGQTPPGSFAPVGPEGWLEFAAAVGIKAAVLYPTNGLAFGRITDVDWAMAVARAYNDWLCETYLRRSPCFKGMALVPLQEPEAAVAELRRAVSELGMCGGMLPSTGLKAHLGAKEFWPLYAEADRLGCALAIHGGSHNGLGLDTMDVFAAAHALGHPFGMLVNFAGMVFHRVFERFPNVRFGFLEAGVAWLLLALERFDGSFAGFTPFDVRQELLRLEPGRKVSDYIVEQIRAGRIFVGCEGDEPLLAQAVKAVGAQPFVFSSDFPHEVNADSCREEVDELLANNALTEQDLEAILSRNAERLYGLASSEAGASRKEGK